MMQLKRLLGCVLAAMAVATTVQGIEGDAEQGKAAAQGCAGCHGPQGEGMGPNPNIADMSAEAFVQALKEYKDGTRQNAMKQAITANLTEQDMADLAAYYAAQ